MPGPAAHCSSATTYRTLLSRHTILQWLQHNEAHRAQVSQSKDYRISRPRRAATVTASVRLAALSLSMIEETWNLTVWSLTCSR